MGRTPAELLRMAARVVLWCVIGLLLLRGAEGVLSRDEREPGPRRERSVAVPRWPDDAARAFAVRFAWGYLSYSPRNLDEYVRSLGGLVSPGVAAELAPRVGEQAPGQVVQAAMAAGSVLVDDRHALVTVATRVAAVGRVGWRFVTVPVARDDRGGLVVYELPSFAPPPARAQVMRPESEPVAATDRAEIEGVLARFLRGYLSGASDDLTYLVPPGVRIAPAAGRFELASLVSVAEPVPASASRDARLVLATVNARDVETGVIYALRFRVRLVRRDRWYVAQVNGPGPRGEG